MYVPVFTSVISSMYTLTLSRPMTCVILYKTVFYYCISLACNWGTLEIPFFPNFGTNHLVTAQRNNSIWCQLNCASILLNTRKKTPRHLLGTERTRHNTSNVNYAMLPHNHLFCLSKKRSSTLYSALYCPRSFKH